MGIGDPSLGLGEYLTLYAILGVAIFAVLGWALGAAGGAAFVFFLGVSAVIFVAFIIISRGYRFLLHGSLGGEGGDSGGGEI